MGNTRTGDGRRRREDKRKAAEARQEYRAKLSPEEQLAVLDRRLGAGKGATKERGRLEVQILVEQGVLPSPDERARRARQ